MGNDGTRRVIKSHIGLRGLAACGVIGVHLNAPHLLFGGSNSNIFPRGFILVDLFFILSGFIMAYVYLANFASKPLWPTYLAFLRARIARIVPLYVFVLVAYAAFVWLLTFVSAQAGREVAFVSPLDAALVKQLLFIGTWTVSSELVWNYPSWSLSAEMQIYLLFPAFAGLFLVKPPIARRGVAVAIVLAIYLLLGPSIKVFDWRGIPRCAAGFILGMLVSDIHQSGFRIDLRWQYAAAGLVLALLASPIRDILIIPPMAALVFLTVDGSGPVDKFLRSKFVLWLGERSYSIYLLHVPIIMSLRQTAYHVSSTADAPWHVLWLNILAIIMILIGSELAYRFVEIPSRARVQRWLRGAAASETENGVALAP